MPDVARTVHSLMSCMVKRLADSDVCFNLTCMEDGTAQPRRIQVLLCTDGIVLTADPVPGLQWRVQAWACFNARKSALLGTNRVAPKPSGRRLESSPSGPIRRERCSQWCTECLSAEDLHHLQYLYFLQYVYLLKTFIIYSLAAELPLHLPTRSQVTVHPIDTKNLQRVHRSERPHQCSYCGNSFMQKSHLVEHLRIHTGLAGAHLWKQGKTCGDYIPGTKRQLLHCHLCPYTTVHRTHMKDHQRMHSGERPHQCSHCGKGFVQKRHLVDHLCTHTGEKPFHCQLCPIMFTRKSSLAAHMRKQHTNPVTKRIRPGKTSEDDPIRLTARHFIAKVPQTSAQGVRTQRRCHVCANTFLRPKHRKDTRYMCVECNKALCPERCFKDYHTMKVY
ncbi:uncharacterized protein LOC144106794 [Amblyomma americanum]